VDSFQDLLSFSVLRLQLILSKVPLDPRHPDLFLPAFDDIVLNATSLLIFYLCYLVAHECFGFLF
jgi:hypothetical protein